MRQLRPFLTPESFLSSVQSQKRTGYRLAYVEAGGNPVAVAGFRILESLAGGRFLYVDDLVTHEKERSRGHGARLLAWLRARAEAESCAGVHLDSGVQRKEAHRFYERECLKLTSYHFELSLAKAAG